MSPEENATSTPGGKRPVQAVDQVNREFDQFWDLTDKRRLASPDSQRPIIAAAHKLGAYLF
jgi:hypothetical protein